MLVQYKTGQNTGVMEAGVIITRGIYKIKMRALNN